MCLRSIRQVIARDGSFVPCLLILAALAGLPAQAPPLAGVWVAALGGTAVGAWFLVRSYRWVGCGLYAGIVFSTALCAELIMVRHWEILSYQPRPRLWGVAILALLGDFAPLGSSYVLAAALYPQGGIARRGLVSGVLMLVLDLIVGPYTITTGWYTYHPPYVPWTRALGLASLPAIRCEEPLGMFALAVVTTVLFEAVARRGRRDGVPFSRKWATVNYVWPCLLGVAWAGRAGHLDLFALGVGLLGALAAVVLQSPRGSRAEAARWPLPARRSLAPADGARSASFRSRQGMSALWRHSTCLGMLVGGGMAPGMASAVRAAEHPSAERGREILLGRALLPGGFSLRAYERAWNQWGVAEKPTDYARDFRERYGLHPAPYPNGDLPMGLREVPGLFGRSIATDCLLCHAGTIAGQTIIGLPNTSLDLQGLVDDLIAAGGFRPPGLPPLSTVRGTVDAGTTLVYMMRSRDADLNFRETPLPLAYREGLCQDVPAWWHLRKKATTYHTGSTDVRSVRTLMPFLLSPFTSGAYIKAQEPAFADLRAYLLTLEPPEYPFPVDRPMAARGRVVFERQCARCHGTYGPGGSYPNMVVPVDVIGTDRTLAEGIPAEAAAHYLESWFGQERGPDGEPYLRLTGGYQAPPLDAVWATAPYFHNGSVPTVYHVLNSRARPKVFTRSYRSDRDAYDPDRLGWRVRVLEEGADPSLPPRGRRQIYDTTQPGRGNGGHTFGDKLSEDERRAVIEYLKTL